MNPIAPVHQNIEPSLNISTLSNLTCANLSPLVPKILPSPSSCTDLKACALAPLEHFRNPLSLPVFSNFEDYRTALLKACVEVPIDASKVISLLEFNNDKFPFSNALKCAFLSLKPFDPPMFERLLEIWKPTLDGNELYLVFIAQPLTTIRPSIETLALLADFSQGVTQQGWLALYSLHRAAGEKEFLKFWDAHKSQLMDPANLQTATDMFIDPSFLEFLHRQGCPSSLFVRISPLTGLPALQAFIRSGNKELVQRIAKDLSIDRLEGGGFAIQEEFEDCLKTVRPLNITELDFKPEAVGRHGCRAVVFAEDGQVHSFPGQDAEALVAQFGEKQDLDLFTIYFNPGHGSIAFKDGHFGFHPQGNPEDAILDPQRIAMRMIEQNGPVYSGVAAGILAAGITGMQTGTSSITHGYHSSTAVNKFQHSYISSHLDTLFPTQPCAVINNSAEKHVSDSYNALTLTVYAPKTHVAMIRKFMDDTKTSCQEGKETYNAIYRNCLDFIQRAIESSGIKADFRDAFHTKDFLGHYGIGTYFSLFGSKQPIVHQTANNTQTASYADWADLAPRATVPAAILGIPSAIFTYVAYKGMPKAIANAQLAATRIRAVAIGTFSLAAALATLPLRALRFFRP